MKWSIQGRTRCLFQPSSLHSNNHHLNLSHTLSSYFSLFLSYFLFFISHSTLNGHSIPSRVSRRRRLRFGQFSSSLPSLLFFNSMVIEKMWLRKLTVFLGPDTEFSKKKKVYTCFFNVWIGDGSKSRCHRDFGKNTANSNIHLVLFLWTVYFQLTA